jgi:hypothetical protein
MHTTTSNPKIKLRNAEQFLGSKRKRYFTSGFKKINCILGNYQYSDDKLTASVKLNWGKGWSMKDTGRVERHMGSIESFSIAMRSLELFLIIKYNLSDEEIADSFIRKIEFKTKPCDHHADRPIDVEVTSIDTKWKDFTSANCRFNIIVTNFHFVVEVDFNNQSKSVGFPYERFSQSIAYNPEQYYNHGYKATSIDIENLVLNLATRSLIAESRIKRSIPNTKTGIGTSKLKGLTFIDFLRIAGQLTQILLYKLDNISREDSNNMWVRSLSAEFCTNSTIQVAKSKAHFTEFNLVKIKAETWRTATAQFKIGNMKGSAKVCHILNIKEV